MCVIKILRKWKEIWKYLSIISTSTALHCLMKEILVSSVWTYLFDVEWNCRSLDQTSTLNKDFVFLYDSWMSFMSKRILQKMFLWWLTLVQERTILHCRRPEILQDDWNVWCKNLHSVLISCPRITRTQNFHKSRKSLQKINHSFYRFLKMIF